VREVVEAVLYLEPAAFATGETLHVDGGDAHPGRWQPPEENAMPTVTIQITREGTTPEQKAALIKGATDVHRDVLSKPPGLTFVAIRGVGSQDWGVDGLPTTEYRLRAAAGSPG
jgi:4-oxalocrotonate tautomerase